MTTVIDDLLVTLGYDADTSGAKKFDASLNDVLSTIGKVGTAIVSTGAIVSGAFSASALSTTKTIDETERLARVANLTTQELQYLTAGTDRYGISQEKLADMLKDVNDKTGDFIATGGGGMADFFENIGNKVGVTAAAFEGLSGQQGLQLYYDTLKKANVSQQEMTFYLEAIASDATMLIPLLENGGEGFTKWGEKARAAGLVMNESELNANKEFIDNLESVRIKWEGFKTSLATNLTPYLGRALDFIDDHADDIDDLVYFIESSFGKIESFFTDYGDDISSAMSRLYDYLFLVWDSALWARDGLVQLYDKLGLTGHGVEILAGLIALLTANFVGFKAIGFVSTLAGISSGFMSLLNPVALVGGLLIAFFLIAQDIYGFVNGQDSLIGSMMADYPFLQNIIDLSLELVEAIKRIWTDNQETFAQMMVAGQELYDAMKPFIDVLIDNLPAIFGVFLQAIVTAVKIVSVSIKGLLTLATGLYNILSFVFNTLFGGEATSFEVFLDSMLDKIKSAIGYVGALADSFSLLLDGEFKDAFNVYKEASLKVNAEVLGLGNPFFEGSGKYPARNQISQPAITPTNQAQLTQHITVANANEAANVASRTVQATRQANYGYQ